MAEVGDGLRYPLIEDNKIRFPQVGDDSVSGGRLNIDPYVRDA